MPSLATFNANNLFLRYRFANIYPGDLARKSKSEAATAMGWGFLPQIANGRFSSKSYVFWDDARRKATAQALKAVDGRLPDILCLQEVESMAALRKFNDDHLGAHYSNFMLVDGLDRRQIDVAVASIWPIIDVRSHVDLCAAGGERIFSRDCLEVTIAIPGDAPLTLFVNHLKSKLALGKTQAQKDADTVQSHAIRRRQAETVAKLVSQRMAGRTATALYAVVGDFNDTPSSPSVTPLTRHTLLTDVLAAHLPVLERYTYFWRGRNRVSQIDYILASKALARRIAGRAGKNSKRAPHIERAGLGFVPGSGANAQTIRNPSFTAFEPDARFAKDADGQTPAPVKVPFDFKRLPSVQAEPKAPISDHAPVKIWF
jgi:endonuclease/exonuclease/phosphatase family metal-dependent hydrolase